MVMAGGTGGHVFPALDVAMEMRSRGWQVFWIGRPEGFEGRLLPQYNIELEAIEIQGVRGKGLIKKILMPVNLLLAVWQSVKIIQRRKPDVVLGMGGFASGPGGLAAWLMRKPLVIQEQNTIPGMTNSWLARIAARVFEAFPGSFASTKNVRHSGNPVRPQLFKTTPADKRILMPEGRNPHLLVLGGSLGAQALNELIPQAIGMIEAEKRPEIIHQSGADKIAAAGKAYQDAGVAANVVSFIDDMYEAYSWADLMICRSGALTVSELTAVGVGSILVPFPYAVDDHQTKNAAYLVNAGAAELYQQKDLTAQLLASRIAALLSDKAKLTAMANAAKSLAMPESVNLIADACEEVALC